MINKKFILSAIATLLLFSMGLLYSQSTPNNFNHQTDLFIAQFDNIPDADDVHAQAAVACLLSHPSLSQVNYLAVAGAYGKQISNEAFHYIDSRSLFSLAFGIEGKNWVDAHLDRNGAVQHISDKVQAILNAGGKVWVMEAGQADVSALWLHDVINNGVAAQTVKDNVIIVQHSLWNERNASKGTLDTVKKLATYVQIDDGNNTYGKGIDRGANTPKYKTETTNTDLEFLSNALSASNPNTFTRTLWTEANNIIVASGFNEKYSPIDEGGLDFSDTVEAMWIFNLAGDTAGLTTVSDFWNTFVINTPTVGHSSHVIDEIDGVVVIEAENTHSNLGKWLLKSTPLNNDYTGIGYLEFDGNTTINGDQHSPLEYVFNINTPGLYKLELRCARETLVINGKERSDVANDCYVRVEGDYHAGPNPGTTHATQAELSVLQSDTKFFGGDDHTFVWASGNRLDLGGHNNKRIAIYNFKAGETYKLVISGRSRYYKLDRIAFRKIE